MDLQPGLSAFAQLQQDQGNGAAFFVADKCQIFRFQRDGSAADDQLRQTLRFVDEEKISAVAQRLGRGAEQFLWIAEVIPTGDGGCLIGRTAGEVGGIGNAAVKGANKIRGKIPQIPAYTAQTGRQIVALNVG